MTSQDSLQNSVTSCDEPAMEVQGRPCFCIGVIGCVSQRGLVSPTPQRLYSHSLNTFFGQSFTGRHVAGPAVESHVLDAAKI